MKHRGPERGQLFTRSGEGGCGASSVGLGTKRRDGDERALVALLSALDCACFLLALFRNP